MLLSSASLFQFSQLDLFALQGLVQSNQRWVYRRSCQGNKKCLRCHFMWWLLNAIMVRCRGACLTSTPRTSCFPLAIKSSTRAHVSSFCCGLLTVATSFCILSPSKSIIIGGGWTFCSLLSAGKVFTSSTMAFRSGKGSLRSGHIEMEYEWAMCGEVKG